MKSFRKPRSSLKTNSLLSVRSKTFCFLLAIPFLILFLFIQGWAQDIDILRPNKDGAEVRWIDTPDADSDYKAIDEIISDSDTTYLWQDTILKGQTFLVQTANLSGVIDSLQFRIWPRTVGTGGTPQIRIGRQWVDMEPYPPVWHDCTFAGGFDTISITSSYMLYSETWTVDPCDGGAWTNAKINSPYDRWYFDIKTLGTVPGDCDSFGLTSGGASGANAVTYANYERFLMGTSDGLLERLKILYVYAPANDSVKLAIYSDSTFPVGTYPRYLLYGDNVGIPAGNTWVQKVTSSVNLTAGLYYWLAYHTKGTDTTRYQSGGATTSHRWIARSWSTAWPSSHTSSGWDGTNANQTVLNAVYSTTEVGMATRVTKVEMMVFSTAVAGGQAESITKDQEEDLREITRGGITR